MRRLLVTGASGFVGQNLARYFKQQGYEVIAAHRNTALPPDLAATAPSVQLDIRNATAVTHCIATTLVDAVLHAAGNKNLRNCETHPNEAHRTNVEGAANVARACRTSGVRMVYISTDLIFAGTHGWYAETDQPASPLVYGRSKYEGEKLVQQELENAVICRSGGLYGRASPLLQWLTRELVGERRVECFTDVYNTPTYVWNLAEMIEAILLRDLRGIFHTVGPQRVNRFEFFRAYAREFALDHSLIVPSKANGRKEELFLQADASLACERTRAEIASSFNDVAQGLKRLKEMGGV